MMLKKQASYHYNWVLFNLVYSRGSGKLKQEHTFSCKERNASSEKWNWICSLSQFTSITIKYRKWFFWPWETAIPPACQGILGNSLRLPRPRRRPSWSVSWVQTGTFLNSTSDSPTRERWRRQNTNSFFLFWFLNTLKQWLFRNKNSQDTAHLRAAEGHWGWCLFRH